MRQAGPLQAVEIFNSPDNKWVILFHGYGADAQDLASLSDCFDFNEKNYNWLLPNAPHVVPIGPGFTGRAWWNIRLSDLPDDWTDLQPDGMEQSVQKIFKLVSSMKFDWKDLIIGGFSQGAMLATEVYLRAPETPAGLMCLSGTLLNQTKWQEYARARSGEKILMSHGESDLVLPHKGSQKLQNFMEKNNIKTQFASFRGGHEIPISVIDKMRTYLKERI